MGLKNYKPTSSARRHMTVSDFAEITKAKPEKTLTKSVKKTGGRNNHGHITTRHIGGGHKRRYRIIDWRRDKDGVPAKVAAIEYDPNRTARIALLHYEDGEKRYILAPVGVAVGDMLTSGDDRRHPPGQRPAGQEHPARHGHPQRRDPARLRRQDDPLRRLLRPADGEGGRLRPDPHAVRRGPHGARWTARPPSGSSPTSRTPPSGSARPARAAGWASARPSAAWP